jgi:hypothetical protein
MQRKTWDRRSDMYVEGLVAIYMAWKTHKVLSKFIFGRPYLYRTHGIVYYFKEKV